MPLHVEHQVTPSDELDDEEQSGNRNCSKIQGMFKKAYRERGILSSKAGVHNSNLMADQNVTFFKGCIYQEYKLKA